MVLDALDALDPLKEYVPAGRDNILDLISDIGPPITSFLRDVIWQRESKSEGPFFGMTSLRLAHQEFTSIKELVTYQLSNHAAVFRDSCTAMGVRWII